MTSVLLNSAPTPEAMKQEALIKNLEGIISRGLNKTEQKTDFLDKLTEAIQVVPERKMEEDKKLAERMAFLAMFPMVNPSTVLQTDEAELSETELSVEPLHDAMNLGAVDLTGIPVIQELEEQVSKEVRRITDVEVAPRTAMSLDMPQPVEQTDELLDAAQIAQILQKAAESGEVEDATSVSMLIQQLIENNGVAEKMGMNIESPELLDVAVNVPEIVSETAIIGESISPIAGFKKVIADETELQKPEADILELSKVEDDEAGLPKVTIDTAEEMKPKIPEIEGYQPLSGDETQLSANLKMLQAIYNTEFIDRTLGASANIVQDYFDLINSRVIDSLKFALRNEMQTINIDLSPGMLGRISISISAGADGVEAKLSVSSKMTNDILTQNIGELHSAIKSHGVQLKNLEVDFSRQNELRHEEPQKHHEPQEQREQKDNRQSEAQINYQNILRSFLEEDLSDG